MNITYKTDYGILELEPTSELREADFEQVGNELKRLQTEGRDLKGVLVKTEEFPGYQRFGDLLAHAEFVSDHGDEIPKVALCTDSRIGSLLEVIGDAFTEAEVERFDFADTDRAEKWILS